MISAYSTLAYDFCRPVGSDDHHVHRLDGVCRPGYHTEHVWGKRRVRDAAGARLHAPYAPVYRTECGFAVDGTQRLCRGYHRFSEADLPGATVYAERCHRRLACLGTLECEPHRTEVPHCMLDFDLLFVTAYRPPTRH